MRKLITLLSAVLMVFGFVAIVAAAESTIIVGTTCENGDPGYINRGCNSAQNSCSPFDYQDTNDCSSYCGQKGLTHRLFINLCLCETAGAFTRTLVDGDTVDVSMTIMVDKHDSKGPVTGDNGVYWADDVNHYRGETYSGGGITMQPFVHDTEPCGDISSEVDSQFNGPFIYLLANGSEGSVRSGRDSHNNCDFSASNRVVKIIADTTYLGSGNIPAHGYVITTQDTDPVDFRCNWFIDIPRMVVDPTVVNRNDDVYVKVCLTAMSGDPADNHRPLCPGEGCCYELFVGTMCCPQDSELVFPYVTDMGNELWWFGMVLTSASTVEGNVTISYYEKDGDRASYTTTIDPLKMLILTPTDLLTKLVLSPKSTGDKVLGDFPGYFVVDADVLLTGFCMMGEPTTGQSMGYLPQGGSIGACQSQSYHND